MDKKNLIGGLNVMKEIGVKPNFSELARIYEVDRHTVSKYWNGGDPQPADGRSGRASGFDRVSEEILDRCLIPGVTAKGIHEKLLQEHADDKKKLPGYGAFTHWLRVHGVVVGGPAEGDPEAHPRFETAPGEQGQFDWKENIVMHNREDVEFLFNVFTATLSYSRLHVFKLSERKTRDDLLRCLYLTLCFLNGTPAEWLTDNMSAIVSIKADGGRVRDERVLRFAKDAGFSIALCKARTPQTKGKDESCNRFLSRLLAYDRDFDDWDDLDRIVAHIQARSNAQANRTTGMPPAALFSLHERDALRPVGNLRLLEQSLGQVCWQVVPDTMLVSAAGCEWSVPRRLIGRKVRKVMQPDGRLLVFDGDDLVASHDTTQRNGRPYVYQLGHYVEALADKEWGDIQEDIEAAAQRNLERIDAIGGLR